MQVLNQQTNEDITKSNQKENKRTRVISQQAIQLIGERISNSNDENNVASFQMRNHQPSSFENFMSFNNHYGTNRQILQPSLEIQKQLLSHEKSAPRFDRSSDLNSGIKSDNALSNINYSKSILSKIFTSFN